MRQDVRLSDRFDLSVESVLLGGTQALVRLMLMQAARDRAAGLRTAGLVTGYRGSPLGGVDLAMTRAGAELAAAGVVFQPGLNEDLAATALWGSQQAGLRGPARADGVFGLWYGKGPGVDRSGDALRHASLAGTAALGGVLAAMGDDHIGESSTTVHQSEPSMMAFGIPVLSPAGVQEVLDFGLYGIALSRFAGLWCGLKLVKDTVESTAVVDGRPDRLRIVTPDFDLPPGGLNIRRTDHWTDQEDRHFRWKLPATLAFARANALDRVQGRGRRIGIMAAGKSWLDLVHALDLLGIDTAEADRLGLTLRKVGLVWPLEPQGLRDWALGLDLIVLVEEKRKLIESQSKEILYGLAGAPRIYGSLGGTGRELFPVVQTLDPVQIAVALGQLLVEEGIDSLAPRVIALRERLAPPAQANLARRQPWFCAGCPHNSATRLPEGARAGGGIGCHTLALWMDRGTEGLTHMGAEGANWIGEAPFVTATHVFQNMGDGTFNHSGLMAIRAAVAAGVNITYKILFNDAVAMTGGQANDGALTAGRLAAELAAAGVVRIVVVSDPKEPPDPADFPAGTAFRDREDILAVQRELAATAGVTALIHVQTCAAEKRRRRRRGDFPAEASRIWIDPEVCEGCGDCGVQSNCIAVEPLETPLGRKRRIDQSACNRDFSCLGGFCPSFVTITGGTPRRAATEVVLPDLPEPPATTIAGTRNLVLTGIGGTGVVTLGAVIAMAAHLDGKAAAMIEMTGLAQKGGAVTIHCRLAETPAAIRAVRVAAGECDLLLGGDMVVTTGAAALALTAGGRTRAVVNSHETPTGAVLGDRDFRLPMAGMSGALGDRLGPGLLMLDASDLAQRLLGDRVFANMILLGRAFQDGLLPLSRAALEQAIRLNGAAVEGNLAALAIGRATVVPGFGAAPAPVLPDPVETRATHLELYQDAALAATFRATVARFSDPELRLAVAGAYHKVLAVKDEYEVARLLATARARAGQELAGDLGLTFHMAPPILSRRGSDGRPVKRRFGRWMERLFPLLAAMKPLRGTVFDPFGHGSERREDRRFRKEYEADLDLIGAALTPATRGDCLALARLPLAVRGFGPVRAVAMAAARAERDRLRAAIAGGPLRVAAE